MVPHARYNEKMQCLGPQAPVAASPVDVAYEGVHNRQKPGENVPVTDMPVLASTSKQSMQPVPPDMPTLTAHTASPKPTASVQAAVKEDLQPPPVPTKFALGAHLSPPAPSSSAQAMRANSAQPVTQVLSQPLHATLDVPHNPALNMCASLATATVSNTLSVVRVEDANLQGARLDVLFEPKTQAGMPMAALIKLAMISVEWFYKEILIDPWLIEMVQKYVPASTRPEPAVYLPLGEGGSSSSKSNAMSWLKLTDPELYDVVSTSSEVVAFTPSFKTTASPGRKSTEDFLVPLGKDSSFRNRGGLKAAFKRAKGLFIDAAMLHALRAEAKAPIPGMGIHMHKTDNPDEPIPWDWDLVNRSCPECCQVITVPGAAGLLAWLTYDTDHGMTIGRYMTLQVAAAGGPPVQITTVINEVASVTVSTSRHHHSKSSKPARDCALDISRMSKKRKADPPAAAYRSTRTRQYPCAGKVYRCDFVSSSVPLACSAMSCTGLL